MNYNKFDKKREAKLTKTICEKSMLGKAWVTTADNTHGHDQNIVHSILSSRGITSPADIERFLNPSIKDIMPDPFVLKDMERATMIAADSIIAGDKVAIFGDYDVDGITSTAVIIKYLRQIGVETVWHLPSREEGYGLNNKAIDMFVESGAKTLITVDCGISANAQVEYAKSQGMHVIVTDHHDPDYDSGLPLAADAVINPKRPDDTSDLKYMAGVGVAFMFLVALNRELKNRGFFNGRENINLMEYMDLVALGTICDVMMLVGLNRAFVATGIKVMEGRRNLGLRVLMESANIKTVNTYACVFVVGPRLNAAGRLDSAMPALELLLTDNPLIAHDLVDRLNKLNAERVKIQNHIMDQAMDMARELCGAGRRCLLICGDNWHTGIMGIIAGRLKDLFYLPTFVATRSEGVIDGSGRSVPGVDLGKIIHQALAAGILNEGGGHAAAAGFSMKESNGDAFCEFVEQKIAEQLGDNELHPEIVVDAEIDATAANMGLIREMSEMAPFGQGNPEPTLVVRGGTLGWANAMSNNHVRGTLRDQNGRMLQFVGFNLAATPVGQFLLDDANVGRKITMCGKLKENEWQNRVSVQFVVEDMIV